MQYILIKMWAELWTVTYFIPQVLQLFQAVDCTFSQVGVDFLWQITSIRRNFNVEPPWKFV